MLRGVMVTRQILVLKFQVRIRAEQQQIFNTMKYPTDSRGREVGPVRIDRNTVGLVPKDKATSDYAERFKKKCERSQKMAMNLM